MSTLPETSQERDILLAALDLPEEQRDSFVNGACLGRSDLRERILKLLQAAALEGSFMEKPILDLPQTMASAIAPSEVETVGNMIGPFKLLQAIGEGGMGSVYMAEQKQPVERRVALKIIKAGMDSRQVIARFEAERQALAMMDHPNIAKVLDAGTTNFGRPYFVMELVKGIPITKYCDDKKLTVRQRLELMIPVCNAIQHAHQKGIIHRDIKPGNILVAQYDGKPVPKVIDFGIAKATAQKLTEKSMFTEFGQIIGTLEYMSPEQAELNQLDIDTRSDVYSLGVLLYELLTGSTPLDGERMRSLAFVEMLRMIREDEPPRPSNRLSTIDTLANVAANRQTEPAKLSGLLRGELDWIVLMALDKDRNRRYETAIGLAQDIERFLQDQPVAACPPSSTYRFFKFAKRNKVLLTTCAFVTGALCVGIAGTTWQAHRAMQAESRASEQLLNANASLSFLLDDLLSQALGSNQADRNLIPDPDLTVRKALDRAAESVRKRFKGKPKTEAQTQLIIGRVYTGLGEHQKAKEHLQRAVELRTSIFGAEHEDTRIAMRFLVDAKRNFGKGDTDELIRLWEEERDRIRRTRQPNHPDSLNTLVSLGVAYSNGRRRDEAIKLFKEVIEVIRNDNSDAGHQKLKIYAESQLASTYADNKQWKEAMELLENAKDYEAQNIKQDLGLVTRNMETLGHCYKGLAQYQKAIDIYTTAIETRTKLNGPDHLQTVATKSQLAEAYTMNGDYVKSMELYESIKDRVILLLRPDDPDLNSFYGNLAVSYCNVGKAEAGIEYMEKAVSLNTQTYGAQDRKTLQRMRDLFMLYNTAGRKEEARILAERTVIATSDALGVRDETTLRAKFDLAGQYLAANRADKAVKLLEEVSAVMSEDFSESHPTRLKSISYLGWAYMQLGRDADAIRSLEKASELPKNDESTRFEGYLGIVYVRSGRLEDAIPLLQRARDAAKRKDADFLDFCKFLSQAYVSAGKIEEAKIIVNEMLMAGRSIWPDNSIELARCFADGGLVLLELSDWQKAEPILRECQSIRERTQPDDWRTFNTHSMLGASLLGQRKLAEAEPLLLFGVRGDETTKREYEY